MSVLDLARPEIRAMQPYSSARTEACGGSILLDANESPWPSFGDSAGWNRYPDPQPADLVVRLAELYGTQHDCVLVGRGSDEGIDLLVRAFCSAGRDAILISPPTFGMYAVCAQVQGAGLVEVPLRRDFSLDLGGLLAALTPSVKLVFMCSPNNPTGVCVPRADILRLAAGLAGRAVLVVDEAYVEFVDPDDEYGSVAESIGLLENLVVLRTLSKAWALAGVRIGVLLADVRVVALLRKLMSPYPLPVPCVEAALAALTDGGRKHCRARVARVCDERERMRAELTALACVREVLPSNANFLTVRLRAAGTALAALLSEGVVVRDVRRYPKLGDALRISIGTPEENGRVLAALADVSGKAAAHSFAVGLENNA